jgi:hypothetical protein
VNTILRTLLCSHGSLGSELISKGRNCPGSANLNRQENSKLIFTTCPLLNHDSPIGAAAQREFDSSAIGVDVTVPLYLDKLWLKGKNLDDIRGGILQGINVTTGREVHSEGGWVELGARPMRWFSLHAGYSMDNPRDTDLPVAGPTVGRAENRIFYGAIRGYFDPIEIGLDYLHWTTEYNGGFDDGTDNRFQGFISYKI